MKCLICNNKLDLNNTCSFCGYINSNNHNEEVENFFKDLSILSLDYENFVSAKEPFFEIINKKPINSSTIALIEKCIIDGEEFSNKIQTLLDKGKKLWSKYNDDETTIKNIHNALAKVSEIDNSFDRVYCTKLSEIINNLKK